MNQPQSIDDLLRKTSLPTNASAYPEELPTAKTSVTANVLTLRNTFKTEDEFLTVFNPDNQVAFTKDLDRAFVGKAPTLGLVAKAFGDHVRDNWLDIQLSNLAVFSGCKDKMDKGQIHSLIELIAEDYGHLKVTEIMYFFRCFKSGHYGRFYGAVDPMLITCALRTFADERLVILKNIMKKSREKSLHTDYDYQRYKRYYAERTKMKKFYSYNFRSEDFTIEDFAEIWWLFRLGYERPDHGYLE